MKSKNFCLLITSILLIAFVVISMPEIRAQETLIWTDNAYSATGAPVSTPTLTSGTEYRIVAATIFWYNYPGHLEADAQYFTTITINSDDSDYELGIIQQRGNKSSIFYRFHRNRRPTYFPSIRLDRPRCFKQLLSYRNLNLPSNTISNSNTDSKPFTHPN